MAATHPKRTQQKAEKVSGTKKKQLEGHFTAN